MKQEVAAAYFASLRAEQAAKNGQAGAKGDDAHVQSNAQVQSNENSTGDPPS